MKHSLARTALPMLIGMTFGVFFILSCSTVEQSSTQSEQPPSTHQQFEEQLSSLDRQIGENPNEISLRVQKANLLVDYAKSREEPSQRKPVYQNLRDLSASTAQINQYTDELEPVITAAWAEEQSSGMRLLQQNDSETIDTHFETIIAHFENAITIIPDSLVTYSLKATTFYRNGYLNEAVKTLETAKRMAESTDLEISEKLAYLYLESGKLDESVAIYRDLVESQPDDDHFHHGLVNAYILNNQHEKAVDLLQLLVEKYPTRYNYQEALATELYFIFEKEAGLILSNPGSYDPADESIGQLVDKLEDVHSMFEALKSDIPTNEENIYRMAAFYKNSASKLREISASLSLNNESKESIEALEKAHLEYGLPLWERLTEINPDNLEYLTGLRNIYQNLGMEEEAESLERSINF